MSDPTVTVLVCTFNDQQTLADSLQSALHQTSAPSRYRLLVIDDGSTDATRWILDNYRGRVEVCRVPRNAGLAAACNEGLRRIDTPWFVRLDTDDRFDPALLASLLSCQASTGADLVTTDRWEQFPDGRRRRRRLSGPESIGDLIAAGTLLPTGTVRELGGYRPLFWEEFDLYLRLLESGRCAAAHVALALYTYRIGGGGQMTSDESALAAGWEELRQLWPESVLERYGLLAGSCGGVAVSAR